MEIELLDHGCAMIKCACGARFLAHSPGRDIQASLGDGVSMAVAEDVAQDVQQNLMVVCAEGDIIYVNLDETRVISCECGAGIPALERFRQELGEQV